MGRVVPIVLAVITVIALAAPASPVLADHLTLVPEAGAPVPDAAVPDALRSPIDVDVNLKLDLDGFRLAARVAGEKVFGAWLNGRMRRDGFSVDGRLQEGGQAYNFRLDADFDRLLGGFTARGWRSGD
jgi:hypothetical protein